MKKLNYIKLILANIIITLIFMLLLMIIPNKIEINLTCAFLYISVSVLFNLFIIEKVKE